MYTFGCIYLGDGQTKKVNKPRVFRCFGSVCFVFKLVFSFVYFCACPKNFFRISELSQNVRSR